MDNLVSLLQAVGMVAINADVRAKILELIQTWAVATEGRHDLSYIGEVYKSLQREGYQFPPRVTLASSMIDSNAVCFASSIQSSPLNPTANSTIWIATGMGRLGCLHAMPHTVYVYEPKTSLPKLRQLFRSAVL